MSSWMRRLFSFVLFAYPRDFRDDYRASMNEHFAAEGGVWPSAARTCADVVANGVSMRLENFWRDVVYAVRMNVKAPLFTVVIVAAIALAIATNTVVFALLDAVLLKPLPYANAEQIGMIWQRLDHGKQLAFTSLGSTQLEAVARASRTFASVSGSAGQDEVSSGGEQLERVPVMRNYFSTLGVRPVLGSFFTASSPERAVVISEKLWRKRYGQSANVLGKRLPVDGQLYTIIGVAPAAMLDPIFGNLVQSDIWTIMRKPSGDTMFAVFPVTRLKDGVSWTAAQADLARVQRNLHGINAPFPGSDLATGQINDSIFAGARGFFWMVYAAVTGILLIACANVANLLIVRGSTRQGEFAVRTAIGASTRRIASQVLTEALLLAAAGAAIGLLLAWAGLPWSKGLVPGNVPRLQSAHIDGSVLAYVCGLLLAVTVLTGLLPAYRPKPKRGRDAASGVRAALVVVQVAIAFAMATGFGLMLKSFVSLTSVELGFSPHHVYAATIVYKRSMFFTIGQGPAHPQEVASIVRRIRAIPGVADASVATGIPFQHSFNMSYFLSKGWNGAAHPAPATQLSVVQVGQTYFHLLRMPLVSGREFEPNDFIKGGKNVIVNRAFAQAYYPHQNAIGKTIRLSDKPLEIDRIVGVVGDARTSLRSLPQPLMYFPFNGGFGPFYGFAIRTSKEVPGLTKQIEQILRRHEQQADGTITVSPLDDLVAADAASTRTTLNLLGAFAGVALLLGLCGVYSVVAYGTQRRFHELGIRMAVGARPADIVRLVLGSTIVQAAAGVTAGIVLCAFTTRLLEAQLYDTSSFDPRTLVAVAAVLVLCMLSAAAIPACRAALSKPSTTLRYE